MSETSTHGITSLTLDGSSAPPAIPLWLGDAGDSAGGVRSTAPITCEQLPIMTNAVEDAEADEPPAAWPGERGAPLRVGEGGMVYKDRPTAAGRRCLFVEDAPFHYFAEVALWLGESYLDVYNRVMRGRHPYFLASAQLHGQSKRVWRACVSQATFHVLEQERWAELVPRVGRGPGQHSEMTPATPIGQADAEVRWARLRRSQRVPAGWAHGAPPRERREQARA